MVNQTAQVRKQLTGDAIDVFDAIIAGTSSINWGQTEDPVGQVRCWEEAGVLFAGGDTLPGLDGISFVDSGSCRCAIERYIDDESARGEMVEKQRARVVERYTFVKGVGRVVEEIHARLLTEADGV